MKAFIFITAIAVLTSCADGEKNSQTGGQNVYPQCAGLTLVARVPNLPAVPLAVFTGYVNNVLAYDDCNGGNKNGFTFTKPTQPTNGAYEFVLSNATFPYPQPNHQVNLRLEMRLFCGGAIQQGGSRSIPLEDRGGCYYATYSP